LRRSQNRQRYIICHHAFGPITLGKILVSSTLIPGNSGGVVVTINAASLRGGASHTFSVPATINASGIGHGLANATQPGLKELAAWLASQWAGQADRTVPVTRSFNGGAAQDAINLAGGNSASIILNNYAAR
jgi:hypothetical protein